MNTILLSYDLHQPLRRYADLLAFIRAHDSTRLNASAYVLQTSLDAESLLRQALTLVDADDEMWAIDITHDQWWTNSGRTDAVNWMYGHMATPVS